MTTIDTSTEAVERLLEGVTPGPWAVDDGSSYCDVVTDRGVPDEDFVVCEDLSTKDAHFVAAARDLVPALLKERDDMRAKLAEVQAERDAVAEARDMMGRLWDQEKARADRAEAALAASIPADPVTNAGCCQPAKVKPLEWVRHWTGCYTVKSLKAADNGCDVVYYAERAEQSGIVVNTVSKPNYFRCWIDFGREFETLEAAKAAAQADYEARILAALKEAPE